MKSNIKNRIFMLMLAAGSILLSGCASLPDNASNSERLMNSIRKTSSEIYSTAQGHIKSDNKVAIFNLNVLHDMKQSKMSLLLEESLISQLSANGIIVAEKDKKLLSAIGRRVAKTYPMIDYIIAYRMMKCGIEYKDLPNYRYVNRSSVVNVNLRVIDARTGNVIEAKEIAEIETDKIARSAIRQIEDDDVGFSGYRLLNPRPLLTGDTEEPYAKIGVTNRVTAGAGYAEMESGGMYLEGSIGYQVLPRISGNFCVGYFPYELTKELELELKEYDHKFTGHVFPLYLSGEFKFPGNSKLMPIFAAGFGAYVYNGEVEVRDYDQDMLWYEVPDNEFSGSDIVFGMNSTLGLKYVLDRSFDMYLAAQYHHTNYEYGENFQFLLFGINYNF